VGYVFSPIAAEVIPVNQLSLSMTPRIRREPGGLNEHTVESVPLSELHPLAHRQAQVTGWIAFGKRNSEIATILNLSERTVEAIERP
jgi:DNA-binding NarL/FixJ family response regulator